MRIGEIIKSQDIKTYKTLKRMGKKNKKYKNNEIKLGDSVTNLMKHDAHKRVRGALRQIRWG